MLALTLTIFATVAAGLLTIGDIQTRPAIAQRLAEDLNAILSQVVPPELHDNALSKDVLILKSATGKPVTVYRARKGDEIIGFAYSVTGQGGYAGPVELVMGVNAQGQVLGVRVLSHAETPGLGDKIELQKSDWILSFTGLSFANLPRGKWAVKKDGGTFDQFSGATITPRAVVKAVKDGLDFFAANQITLFAKTLQSTSSGTGE
ncbi:electron transporter RnfG [Magnetovibrio blakemorei]|uniref:Ion-translocating oxidoreductase complex subunit G n=1 Tax=Magnetovibrio blakemorei TaxID=28181 RepID=A0A1E5Q6B7_9PROT|nr:electron transporter RnfG [Magnetovibrio blakemorei]